MAKENVSGFFFFSLIHFPNTLYLQVTHVIHNRRKFLVPLWAAIRYKPYDFRLKDLEGLFQSKRFSESLILVLYGFCIDIIDEKDNFLFFFFFPVCHAVVSSGKVESWNPCLDSLALYVKESDEVCWTQTPPLHEVIVQTVSCFWSALMWAAVFLWSQPRDKRVAPDSATRVKHKYKQSGNLLCARQNHFQMCSQTHKELVSLVYCRYVMVPRETEFQAK